MSSADPSVWENVCSHVAFVQRSLPSMRVDGDGALLTVDSGLHSDMFNKILLDPNPARHGDPDLERQVAAAVSAFAASGRAFTLWTEEGAPFFPERPAGGGAAFWARLGLVAAERETAMKARTAECPQPEADGLRVAPVREEADLTAFIAVLAAEEASADPDAARFFRSAAPLLLQESAPMRLFVGRLGDQPVACGELFLSAGGTVAGVHMIVVRRECRRRGLGTAVTLAVMRAAREAGAGAAVLLASAQGLPVYRKLGFRECGLFVEYAPEQEAVPCG